MNRRKLAAATAVVTAAAVVPAAGAFAAGNGSAGKTALTSSGTAGLIGGGQVSFAAPLAANRSLNLTLQLPQRNAALANTLLARGTTLSPAQYATLFGANTAQVARVTAWAKSQGLTVESVSRTSSQVVVRGTTSRVNKAFGVSMRSARHGSVSGYAAQGTPTAPTALGLTGVSGLTALHKMTPQHKVGAAGLHKSVRPATKKVAPRASGTDGSVECADYWGDHLYPSAHKYSIESNYLCGYIPQDLVAMYRVSATYTKAAPSLGILLWNDDTQVQTLTNQYMTQVGYPQLTKYSKLVTAPNANDKQCDNSPIEQDLDVQSSHSLAPNAAIRYYGAASCFDTDLTTQLQKAVDEHKVSTINMSFGTPSDVGMSAAEKAAWDRPLRQAALTGISAFAATGDAGDNSFHQSGKASVGYPATNEYLTAVGGTSVGMRQDGSFATVAAWENRYFAQPDPSKAVYTDVTNQIASQPGSDIEGGGGGVSATWAQPSWQKGKVKGSTTKRVVPDISAVANSFTPFTVHTTDGGEVVYGGVGGTSLASPVVAALVGIAKATNKATIGNFAPKLYSMGASAISDVNAPNKSGVAYPTDGDTYVIGMDAKPESLVSGPGWDNATGLGTPNGAGFLAAVK